MNWSINLRGLALEDGFFLFKTLISDLFAFTYKAKPTAAFTGYAIGNRFYLLLDILAFEVNC